MSRNSENCLQSCASERFTDDYLNKIIYVSQVAYDCLMNMSISMKSD